MGMAKHASSGYGSSVFQGPLTTCDSIPVLRFLIMKTSSGTICRHQAGFDIILSLPQLTVSPPFAFLHSITRWECRFHRMTDTDTFHSLLHCVRSRERASKPFSHKEMYICDICGTCLPRTMILSAAFASHRRQITNVP